MRTLNELIGQKVVAYFDEDISIEGTVGSVAINDYYFQEKNEEIYITISLNPTEEIPEELDIYELLEIPLSNIRKA